MKCWSMWGAEQMHEGESGVRERWMRGFVSLVGFLYLFLLTLCCRLEN